MVHSFRLGLPGDDSMRAGPKVIKNFVLNSVEREIFPAHKC